MTLQSEKALRTGRSAWFRGELETAVNSLQSALRSAENAPEVVYPLARVLSEQGDKAGALEMLEKASSHTHFRRVGEVFRALILYDHGETTAARESLSHLDKTNALGVCLLGLLDFDPDTHRQLRIHRGGRWVSDIAGRLLAVLEQELHRSPDADVDTFHQRLFTSHDDPAVAANPEKPAPLETKAGATESFGSCAQWWEALERAMRQGDHDRLITLHDRADVPEKWRDVYAGLFKTFSLLASGRDKTADTVLAKLLQENGALVWTHFLAGLAAIRRDHRREAIAAFVRSTRIADIDMDRVIQELAKNLKIEIELVD